MLPSNRVTKSRSISDNFLSRFFGISATFSSSWNEEHTVYALSWRSRLLLHAALVADVAVRIHTAAWLSFSFLRSGGIGLKYIVPEASDIMVACSKGDTERIDELFRSR
jgi:hypothetical protein